MCYFSLFKSNSVEYFDIMTGKTSGKICKKCLCFDMWMICGDSEYKLGKHFNLFIPEYFLIKDNFYSLIRTGGIKPYTKSNHH